MSIDGKLKADIVTPNPALKNCELRADGREPTLKSWLSDVSYTERGASYANEETIPRLAVVKNLWGPFVFFPPFPCMLQVDHVMPPAHCFSGEKTKRR